ncbi:RHS repeat domain-containing protein [Streptacidiphilus sp. MAP12-33]|uniref:RHS repeat domain-containing protein n=1 Tax=Streptacidiphilus sp. MAP12-33 TaxID=3156266 RepID=UPI0035195B5D
MATTRRSQRAQRTRSTLTRLFALLTVFTMGSAVLPDMAFAAHHFKGQIWSPPQTPLPHTKGVPGTYASNVKGHLAPLSRHSFQPPKVDLPNAGQSTSALTQGPVAQLAKSQVVSGPAARVGTSPLWVASAANGAAAPHGVQVRFADPAAARKGGIKSGVLFGISRNDTSAASGKVAVQLDPNLLAGEGGADLASRLRLVELPACALTAPQLAACQQQTPVNAVRDPHSGRIVADLTLPATQVPPAGQQAKATAHHASATGSAATAVQATAFSAQTAQTVASPMTVMAAVSGQSGSTGNFAATSLKPSDQWTAGSGAGDFDYSYPITVPAALGGAAPSVALTYSSASVDGENASTNSQPSWIGDGWAGTAQFIERSYQPCSQDGITGSGDTCWANGGHEVTAAGTASGQLVYDDTSGKWHLSSDNGATITHLTGLSNGSYNGEGWEIALQDGTRMYYGAGKLPTAEGGTGSDKATNSVSTEPVYCPKSTDPCYSSTTGTSSYTATMGYRWFLDFVIDPHGNTTQYSYTQETNYYARSSAHTLTAFDRSAYLNTISYGWRAADIASEGATPAPAAKVVFTTATRCIPGSVVGTHTVTTADCASLTSTTAPYWPDVPQDQVCASSGSCSNYSMSFFTEERLTQIQTQVNTGTTTATSYKPVDTYALTQSMPDPGDGTSPALRMDSVVHTGNDGTAIATPAVSFVYAAMSSRVPGAASWPAFNRFRITAIDTETGEAINVTYTNPDCSQSSTSPDLPSPSNDTRRCYQEYWTPPSSTLTADWFEKYLVTEVREIDEVGGAPTRYTDYTYNGTPIWHRNDSAQTANAQRTWDQFRGYASVTKQTGHAPDPITAETTYYLRGMAGDSTSATSMTPRTWPAVTDSLGDQITDSNQYDGFAYETQTYDKAGGKVIRDSISLPSSQLTATHAEGSPAGTPSETAYFVQTFQTIGRSLLADGTTWRTTKIFSQYSATTGLLTQKDDQGDTSQLGTTGSQETCTTYSYATPPSSGVNAGMVALPAETTTVALTTGTGVGTGSCPAKTAATTLTDTRAFYDGNTTAGVIPAGGVGNVTESDIMGPWSGSTESFTAQTTAPSGATGHDAYGRLLSSTNVRGDTTTTSYSPATEVLPTTTVATNVTAGNWQTTTTLDQIRQLPTKVVDPNGNSTSKAYDALGRLTSVWAPGRATTATASTVYVYSSGGQTAVSWTEQKTLREDATYAADYQIYNGFGDLRQDQNLSQDGANSNGTLVSDTFYDSHGWKVKATSQPYYITNAPTSTVYQAADANIPGQTVTGYDGTGRPLTSAFYSYGQPQWTTTTAYPGADRTDTSPPTGGTAATTLVDAEGRTTALWRYHSNTATGNPADATITNYTYTRTTTASGGAATQNTVTDAGQHNHSQITDAWGHPVSTSDPDAGSSSSTYNTAGDLLTSTDANNTTLTYTYDALGRKKTLSQGATELDSWTYDTATGGKGQLASQTSYSGSNQFTQTIAGYTNRGASTGVTTTIPSSEGTLAGTYSISYAYTPVTGLLDHTTYGADGGLPAETVYNSYTEAGTLANAGGNADYLSQIISNPLGQVTRYTLGDTPNQVVQTNFYDTATGRTTETTLDKENGTGHVDDITTLWNPAGKITAQQDIQDSGAATDLQCYAYNGQGQLATAWTDTKGTTSAASPSVPNIGNCNSAAPSATTNGGPAPYWQTYTYDSNGNRQTLTTHDTTGAVTSTQTTTPNTTAQPDTAQSTTTTDNSGATLSLSAYTYFTNGATKNDTVTNGGGTVTSNQTFTYTPDNRTHTVTDSTTGNTAAYTYDAGGNLLEQKNTVSGTTTTLLYLPGEQLTLTGSNPVTGLRYYATGGGPTVIRSSTGTLTYEADNNLGTGDLTLDSALGANAETRRMVTPYGTPRGVIPGTWIDSRGYLGQPTDPSTGYDILGARLYDATTGRFLQADPVLEATDSNQLGGYTYSADDPVNGSDPNGLMFEDPDTGATGGTAATVDSQIQSVVTNERNWTKQVNAAASHGNHWDPNTDTFGHWDFNGCDKGGCHRKWDTRPVGSTPDMSACTGKCAEILQRELSGDDPASSAFQCSGSAYANGLAVGCEGSSGATWGNYVVVQAGGCIAVLCASVSIQDWYLTFSGGLTLPWKNPEAAAQSGLTEREFAKSLFGVGGGASIGFNTRLPSDQNAGAVGGCYGDGVMGCVQGAWPGDGGNWGASVGTGAGLYGYNSYSAKSFYIPSLLR